MKPHRYSSADMEVVPWPKAEPADSGESTTWRLSLDRDVDDADTDLALQRVSMSDPEQTVVVSVGGSRDVVVRLLWDRYDRDALARSVKLVRLIVQVLPVVLVEGVPLSKWSVLVRDS
jgi:hypothetical protein